MVNGDGVRLVARHDFACWSLHDRDNSMKALKTLAVLGVLAAGTAVAGSAQAAVFTIAPSCIQTVAPGYCNSPVGFDSTQLLPGLAPFNADRISHSFNSTLGFTSAVWGGGSTITGTFTDVGNVSFTTYQLLGGNIGPLTTGLGVNYNMYALFNSSGFYSANASGLPVVVNGVFTSFVMDVYIDANMDTSFAGNNTNVAGGITADDVKIATGSLLVGDAALTFGGGLSNGDFNAILQFSTLAAHNGYFFSPNPFYIYVNVDGTPLTITGGPPGAIGENAARALALAGSTFILPGSGTAEFLVPEPASLTLFGAALIGFAALARRRRLNA
jgi:PEP-CTERM motif